MVFQNTFTSPKHNSIWVFQCPWLGLQNPNGSLSAFLWQIWLSGAMTRMWLLLVNGPAVQKVIKLKKEMFRLAWRTAALMVVDETSWIREEFGKVYNRLSVGLEGSSGKPFGDSEKERRLNPRLCLVWVENSDLDEGYCWAVEGALQGSSYIGPPCPPSRWQSLRSSLLPCQKSTVWSLHGQDLTSQLWRGGCQVRNIRILYLLEWCVFFLLFYLG